MRTKYGIKQLSIFLENRIGRLVDVSKSLLDADINIRTPFLADSSEFGILRLIVNNPEKAKAILAKNNFAVNETDVFAVEVEDKPGGFYKVVKTVTDVGIDVEYTYAYPGSEREKAILFFKVKDELFEKSIESLLKNNIPVIEAVKIYS